MTKTELIAMARRGERIPKQPHSLHDAEVHKSAGPCRHPHGWRTIVCDGTDDVCECPDCGAQRVMACNFDDDFS